MPYLPTAVQSVIDRTMPMFPRLTIENRQLRADRDQRKRPEQSLGPLSCLLELSTRDPRIGC